ncbi:MAG: DUF488 family protein, partial [Salinisphaera sp.]|nr:DUF488 family protein [Salinisphaera sp.]
MPKLAIKRVYEPESPRDGRRILVERLWPRGVRKDDLKADSWQKEAAPSTALRKWYRHVVSRWPEFRRRYVKELDGNEDSWRLLLDTARRRKVTLLYSARDVEHNGALVLRDYLAERMQRP